jgi:hypothetical protein
VSSHIKTDCLFRKEANLPTPQTYPPLRVFKPFGKTPHMSFCETLENKVIRGLVQRRMKRCLPYPVLAVRISLST